MKSIRLIMPYFGHWPPWMALYLKSCSANPTINWLFLTDCEEIANLPPNVRFEYMSLAQFSDRIASVLAKTVKISEPRKICDYRLVFGKAFQQELSGYDYWGFGDIDVIYGRMRDFLTEAVLEHDLVTFHKDHLSGHLTILKNTPQVINLYHDIPGFERGVLKKACGIWDELVLPGGKAYDGLQKKLPSEVFNKLKVHAEEYYSTPLSRVKTWIDGTRDYPKQWEWVDGKLTTDASGDRTFLYLHFMYWKMSWSRVPKIVYVNESQLENGFKVTASGFYPLGPSDTLR